jgi:hypothetical protein
MHRRPNPKFDDYTQNSSENPTKMKNQAQNNNRAQYFLSHSEIEAKFKDKRFILHFFMNLPDA